MKNNYIYTAGYIDGDGCFFIQKTSNPIKYRGKIIISSTNIEILKFFKFNFSGHIQQMPIYNINHKIQFHWYINGNKSLEFLKNISNYLIERHQESIYFKKFILSKSNKNKMEIIKLMKNYRFLNKKITRDIFQDIKKTKFLNNFTYLDAAYLAGFIDAECSLGISKYKPKNKPNETYKIILQCNNTSPNIFYWFKEKIGGSFSFIDRNSKNPRHKNQIRWAISGNILYNILEKVYPYIRSKKFICKKLMEFHKTIIPNGGDRQSKEFKEFYDTIISKRNVIVNDIHKFNSKGLKNV